MILHAGEEKWEISPDDILNIEAIMIKKKTGLDFQPWLEAMGRMDPEAITAFVWVAKKRVEPTTRYEDIQFRLASIEFEETDEEKAKREAAEAEAAGPKDEDEAPTAAEQIPESLKYMKTVRW